MAKREIVSKLNVVQTLDPQVYNSDQNSDSSDMQGFDSLMIITNVGISADTLNGSNTIELELEESVDDSVWTDVADVDIITAVAGANDGTFALINDAAEDEQAYKVGYIGNKRYVRAVVNFTGTHSTGTEVGIVAVRGNAHAMPVA